MPKIPGIMVLDRPADSKDEVIHIEFEEDVLMIVALQDCTISLVGPDYPSGTLRMARHQVISFPTLLVEEE